MKKRLFIFVAFVLGPLLYGQTPVKTIHIFVPLCDNINQGIVKVPEILGNGRDLRNNLYWGARFGIKSFFLRSDEWEMMNTKFNISDNILERSIFRYKTANVYLIADAYKGDKIKQAVNDFLESAYGNYQEEITLHGRVLAIGGNSELIVYVGHNGLMDFSISQQPKRNQKAKSNRKAMVFACMSKQYFIKLLTESGSYPLLLTTGLMAPEAYTVKAAIDGWISRESDTSIIERAARAYHTYQHCSLNAARRLFTNGLSLNRK